MGWCRLLPLLCLACGELAPADPDVPDAGPVVVPADAAIADGAADAAPVVTSADAAVAALPEAKSWGRFFDIGRDAKITWQTVAPDGTVYVGAVAWGPIEWGGQWIEAASGDAVSVLLEQRRDGREGWAYVVERDRYTQGVRVSVGDDALYLTVAGSYAGEGYPYVSQTIVALDRATRRELWRWRSPHASEWRFSLGVTARGDDVWVHGSRLWRDGRRALPGAPYLARFDRRGTLIKEWAYDYDHTGDPVPYLLSRSSFGSTDRVFPEADGALVTTGAFGLARWDAGGVEVWHHTYEWFDAVFGDSTRDGDGDLLVLRRGGLMRLDALTGAVVWDRELPPSFGAHAVAVHPTSGELLVTGSFRDLLDYQGELRAAIRTGDATGTGDVAVAWLTAAGERRGLWAYGDWGWQSAPVPHATAHGLVLTGNMGDGVNPWAPTDLDVGVMTLPRPGPMPWTAHYALSPSWAQVAAQALLPCRSSYHVPLNKTPVDLHLLFDISAAASGIVPDTGVTLRQLAGNGLAPLFSSLGSDRVSFVLPPERPILTTRSDRAPWPVVDRRTLPRSGELFSRLVLAPTQLPSQLGSFLVWFVAGARGISLDHVRGSVRHAVMVIIAPSAIPATWNAEQLAALAPGGKPALPVHVLGLGAPSPSLDALAAAAGTTPVYLTPDITVTAAVADAIADIRAGYRCSYMTPTRHERSGEPALVLWRSGQPVTPVPRVASCAPGEAGWMPDERTWSRTILLCDATCDAVAAGGVVELEPYDACR